MTDIAAAWKDHLAEGAPLYSEFEYRSVQSYLDEAAEKYGVSFCQAHAPFPSSYVEEDKSAKRFEEIVQGIRNAA